MTEQRSFKVGDVISMDEGFILQKYYFLKSFNNAQYKSKPYEECKQEVNKLNKKIRLKIVELPDVD